ncbi:MAG: class I SAM-dependent methyltransferase [Chloroflexi bacterium]|nr:class I SAM-dependent methyltransferase [Chloroflexota bacterium]
MTKFQDAAFLKGSQYAGADKLAARISLHDQFTVSHIGLHRWIFDIMLSAIGSRGRVLEVGSGRGDLWKKNATPERKDLIGDDTEKIVKLRAAMKAKAGDLREETQPADTSERFGRIPSGWSITLTDLSAGMLADNKAHLGEDLASRFSYREADVQALPYPDHSFDAVIANYMLYHAPDLGAAVAELRRVLRPGGVLFAMTNGTRHLLEINQFVEKSGISAAASTFGMMNVRLAFSLQNGKALLGTAFKDVVRLDFPTELMVTEVQPILDYVASMLEDPDEVMSGAGGLALARILELQLAETGLIRISKETGMFVAR